MRKRLQLAAVAIAGALLLVAVAGCGGGGGGGTQPPPPPATLLITTTTLNDGVVGVPGYSQTVAATGGTGARTFSISVGALPAGLAIAAGTGVISGTPTGPAGTASFTVMVVDSGTPQQSDTQALTIDINDPLVITTTVLPNATIGNSYNAPVATTGGSGALAFSISSGALPAGLAINAGNGTISGTPTAGATNQTFTMRVADGSNPQQVDTQVLTIVVTLEVATASPLPAGTAGTAYSQTLTARGGLPPYGSWTRTAGSMPAGIADPVAATGVVSGTPSPVCSATLSNFTARVTDAAAAQASKAFDLTVNPGPALNITTTSLPNGTVGVAYSATVQATGGAPPYSFAVTLGNLPSMLNLTAGTGLISGTPDTVETQNFSITVTDSCAATDTQALSITVGNTSLGRNDTIPNATALSNGTFAASISPSGDPNTTLAPDEDFYEITTTLASTVTIDINAQVNGSPLDSVIEIVNAAGTRLATCVSPTFNSPCVSDDTVTGVQLDSFLQIQVGAATTFYVHVVDFRGDARPDLLYDIVISGIQ